MEQYSSWSKRRDSKSRRPGNRCKGSNPFCSAKKKDTPKGVLLFGSAAGIRKDGLPKGQVNKCPVDTFLVRGRIHSLMNAPSMGVGMRILFVVVGYRNNIYSVHPIHISTPFERKVSNFLFNIEIVIFACFALTVTFVTIRFHH